MKTPLKHISLLAAAALSFTCLNGATTQPVGYTTWAIAAGDGSSRAISVLGAPLYQPATSVVGSVSGEITSVSSTSVTVTGAGWQAGQLSSAQSPFILRITSGLAEGRNLLISSITTNTTDTVTVDLAASDVSDVSQLGIVAADTFEIVECDTLSSLLGAPADGLVVGAATSDNADVVYLLDANSVWSRFYYDTDDNRWTKIARGSPDASNTPLMPDSGILYSRLANQSSEVVLTGTVPDTARETSVNGLGVTFLASTFPVDVELSETGVDNIVGWVKNADSAVADVLYVLTNGIWSRFYNDGTNWRKIARGSPISDTDIIPVGSAVLLLKRADAGADLVLNQSLPYTL